ncbi:Trm112 family protein [Haloglycomyces albus]|uniref:Trm112 family protein n=1 Tax=Haloglycomyces albus TaxID=526067 RepID=UPI00046D1F92|nr:Trm112 family protein [Haloglycomyces albus]
MPDEKLPAILFELLRCPADMAKLDYDEENNALVCTECGTSYPVEDNIPDMLTTDEDQGTTDDG